MSIQLVEIFRKKSNLLFLNKLFVFFLCLLLNVFGVFSQHNTLNTLLTDLQKKSINDTSKVALLCKISFEYRTISPTLSVEYALRAQKLAKEINDMKGYAESLNIAGVAYRNLGNYAKAMDLYVESLSLAKKLNDSIQIGYSFSNIGNLYYLVKDYKNSIYYSRQAFEIGNKLRNIRLEAYAYTNMGRSELAQSNSEVAMKYHQEALQRRYKIHDPNMIATTYREIGGVFVFLHKNDSAEYYLHEALKIADSMHNHNVHFGVIIDLSKLYFQRKDYVKAEEYALHLISEVNTRKYYNYDEILQANLVLSKIYEMKGEHKKSLSYLKNYSAVLDSLNVNESIRSIFRLQTSIESEEMKVQIQGLAQERSNYLYYATLITIFFSVSVGFGIVIYKQYLGEKEAKKILESQNQLIISQTEQLNIVNQRLQQANREKNEYLGIVTHDLKNPLSNIRLMASLLQKGDLEKNEVYEFSTMIHDTTLKMFDLIKNLLDLNKIENGGLKPTFSNVNILPIVRYVLGTYEESINKKGITAVFEANDSTYEVETDENIIQQILDNLISNAVKYSPVSGKIVISVSLKDKKVLISIKDHGQGFTDDDKKKLYQRFARLSASPTAGEHSTGLGLSIVKKLSEEIGAEIVLESEYGFGSTFTLILPFKQISKRI